ncbi:MAG: hypothetical protein ACTSWN_16595 [Promethearchaeota archaeon]
MNTGIIIGKWDDVVGLNIMAEYPLKFRSQHKIKDSHLLEIFNECIMYGDAGLRVFPEDDHVITTYYSPIVNQDHIESNTSEEHRIIFLFLDDEAKVEFIKEQFTEFSQLILKIFDNNDFPEIFLNLIDNFAFLDPISEEQRYAAIYNNEIREQMLQKFGEGPISHKELKNWLETTFNSYSIDLEGLLLPFKKAGLLKETLETIKGKKKSKYYFLIKDVYLFRIPPKKMLDDHKKGKFKALGSFADEYIKEIKEYFENYELAHSEIKQISHLLSITNVYKIIKLLRENYYKFDDLKIEFLDRYNFLPSNINYLLKLLETSNVLKIFKNDNDKFLILKSDIRYQVFFPEYLVDKIRKAWRDGKISKKLAIKHLTMLRDVYLEDFMSIKDREISKVETGKKEKQYNANTNNVGKINLKSRFLNFF